MVNQPSVLFLDEVTSGLDEQTDRDMMQLFSRIAADGRTWFVIHNLTNIEACATHLAVLTVGGKLAFFGEPSKMLEYFRIDRVGDVYRRMAEEPAEQWQSAYQRHEAHARLITSVHAAQFQRSPAEIRPKKRTRQEHQRDIFHQTRVLLKRQWSLTWADKGALAVLLVQSLLVAALIILVFGDIQDVHRSTTNDPNLPDPTQSTR
ncbi:MAG: hypothetical protein R3C10_23790 [Pirellulales bacterium]